MFIHKPSESSLIGHSGLKFSYCKYDLCGNQKIMKLQKKRKDGLLSELQARMHIFALFAS